MTLSITYDYENKGDSAGIDCQITIWRFFYIYTLVVSLSFW